MEITRENIDTIKNLTAELDAISDQASAALVFAQENKKNMIKWSKKGQEIESIEKHLWDEVFVLGQNCEAYKALADKYPDTFELIKKQNEKSNELKVFIQGKLGIDYTKIKVSDILRLVEAMIDFKLAK